MSVATRHLTRRIASFAAALLLGAPAGLSQNPADQVAPLAAMRKLDGLVGDWAGSGWSTDATGEGGAIPLERA